MGPSLLPGVDLSSAQTAIDECRTGAINARGSARDADDLLRAYLAWSRTAADRLSHLIALADIDRMILTATYWAMLTVPSSRGAVYTTVQAELDSCVKALEEAVQQLDRQSERWSFGFGPLAVLDTSVFIEHLAEFPESLAMIDDRVAPRLDSDLMSNGSPVQFVIPLQVIDELDKAKADRSRGRARLALARINEVFVDPQRTSTR